MPSLNIIRGLPGSGKSTYARRHFPIHDHCDHYEADMFFEQQGEYRFDATKLHQAHEWCRDKVHTAMKCGRHVVVSNTFVREREFKPYCELVQQYNYPVHIFELRTQYESIHGVPEETMERMRKSWYDGAGLQHLFVGASEYSYKIVYNDED